MSAIYSILLTIDGAIYDLISSMFTIFNFLAKTDLFSNDLYGQIVRRMYVILGMIMMFALAYSLLKAVINPDEFSKGENSFPKLIKNVVISLGIIAVLPTVFTVAFNIQNSILNYDTIPKLVLGEDYNSQVYQDPGRSIAFNTYSAFLHVNEDKCEAKSSSDTILTEEQIKNCGNNIVANTGNRHWYNLWLFPDASSQSFTDVVYSVNNNNISFANFNQFSDAVTKGEISYIPVVSTICGLFLLYVLVNFCFDMAVRVVKLMFFQIIAPIPVVCRVIPGGKMKDVFSTWTKKTISTFIDVFIRIFIMYIGVFVITAVIKNWDNIMLESNLTSGLGLIAKALIIMGVIIFIRQAPKLLADMFHLDAGDMKLGIMDKLAAGGALTAAGALGGGAGMLLKNGAAGVQAFRKTKGQGFGKRLGSAAWGALSTTAGTLSGAARGLYGARGAKNWGDVKKSASSAIATASLRKEKRDNYRAAHTGVNPVDTLLNVSAGHIMDNVEKVGEFMGIDSLEGLKHEKEVADTMQGFYKTMSGYVADNELVMSYQSMYDAEMKREIPSSVTTFDGENFQKDLRAKVRSMMSDEKYANMSQDDLYRIAGSGLDRAQYTHVRELTAKERNDAIVEKQANLKMYDQLKKLATIQAVNEKLNKKDQNGNIIDGRFAEVANQAEVFKKQNATYDFVNNMSDIFGVKWDDSWTKVMTSGNADAVDELMDKFKKGEAGPAFFGDSETAKNHSGAVGAEIGKKLQEKKKDN